MIILKLFASFILFIFIIALIFIAISALVAWHWFAKLKQNFAEQFSENTDNSTLNDDQSNVNTIFQCSACNNCYTVMPADGKCSCGKKL